MRNEAVTNPSVKKGVWNDKMSKNRCAGRLFGTRAFGMGLCLEEGKDGGSVAHMKTRGLHVIPAVDVKSPQPANVSCYHCALTTVGQRTSIVFVAAPHSQLLLFGLFQMVFSHNSLMMLNTPCVNLILFWLFPQERRLLALKPLVFNAVEKLL